MIKRDYKISIQKEGRKYNVKRLIHDNEGVYMIDEECLRKKEKKEQEKEMRWQKNNAQSDSYHAKRKKP